MRQYKLSNLDALSWTFFAHVFPRCHYCWKINEKEEEEEEEERWWLSVHHRACIVCIYDHKPSGWIKIDRISVCFYGCLRQPNYPLSSDSVNMLTGNIITGVTAGFDVVPPCKIYGGDHQLTIGRHSARLQKVIRKTRLETTRCYNSPEALGVLVQ